MTLEQIAALGSKLSSFLALCSECFGRRDARGLLRVYVKGQLSNLHRKTAEAIALQFKTAPRTLQRFLESIKWDEEKLRDRCQQIVAKEHAHREAIGCVDESGTAKSGKETVGASRQWNGNRGKVDNCVVGVHISYSAPDFQVLLDAADLPSTRCRERFKEELEKQRYYQRRNRQARTSHTKTRTKRLRVLGIDVDNIKSCVLPDI